MTADADVLEGFAAATRSWFTGAFGAPTAAQAGAWAAIARGEHTLVIAPTGSGKTLAAFLSAIDRLIATPPGDDADRPGTTVLYISPLKALAVDVERNLTAPLVGIGNAAARLGLPAPEVTVGVRSGDTPPAVRRALVSRPPDILITTPESLYLMLTSSARETLRGVQTVIVDEIHALAPTKRGSHLALSLERLDQLTPRPAQRIGLSATVRPPETVARFLTGTRAQATIVRPPAQKTFDLSVDVPVEDMTNLPVAASGDELDDAFSPTAGSLWPFVEAAIVDLIEQNRATIVFANSRRLAERLTARINEIAAERAGLTADDGFDPLAANPAVPGGMPATISGAIVTGGAPPILARAHHGSVSKEQRADIEDALKSGTLRAVVATSSLELGIDMGAVDLVVQVETPPSVASGLQRIGRAGHRVGEISTGVLFPKHRTDLIGCAVTVDRMRAGAIEELRVPRTPLDILAQQTIAATAVDDVHVDEWFDVVRRAHPYRELTRDVYDAVLDLISGRYPSDEFAGLSARVDYDRAAGILTARRGTLRLAVTSGGTIPDRGLFGVFLAGESADSGAPRRVGELDEEMVYESRVGDVFALGASSWQIVEITPDRVLVVPAAGRPGRLPFWIGDAVGRPAELGAALGRFVGVMGDEQRFTAEADRIGLSPNARANLAALLAEQREATGVLPTEATLVVERFRDELGDWRLILHSPYGLRVHAPWASAIAAGLTQRLGLDGATTATDDGIIVRLPDTDDTPPGAEVFEVDPDHIEDIATAALAGSSLFAARFRECAARALLLPRRDPGRRAPLWQQRQRAAQLLSVAAQFPDFPILLETARECLEDVYDLPALTDVLTAIAGRRIRLVEVETAGPSPFAAAMLLGYTGSFIYDDDAPLAERRATALALDTALLAQLLGRVDLRELLDARVIAETIARLQRTAPERRARDGQDLVDLLRWLGPLSEDRLAERYDAGAEPDLATALAEQHAAGRIVVVSWQGSPRWAAVDDLARLRDGLGIPPPPGVPAAQLAAVDDPVGDLVHRYARTHGPFTAAEAAAELGLGVAVARETLSRLAVRRTVIEGEFLPAELLPTSPETTAIGGDRSQWCHADVLGRLRRGSLAAGRAEVEPVGPDTYARFLLSWQHIGAPLTGVSGLLSVIEQLAGQPIPASALESLILPARVRDYRPALLDELLSSGEVLWSGHGRIGGADGWIALHPADSAPLTLRPPAELETDPLHRLLLDELEGGALRYGPLAAALDETGLATGDDAHRHTALWDLVWSGRLSNDSFAPVRAFLTPGRARSGAAATPSHRVRGGTRPPRLRAARLSSRYLAGADPTAAGAAPVPPLVGGRWALLPRTEVAPTAAAAATCEILLDRYGVVTKGAVAAEEVPGGFARIYKALSVFEDSGQVRRGYFIDRLGGAQFAAGHTVDTLREAGTLPRDRAPAAYVLAATDPASPSGAALGWPAGEEGHRPGRKPGALVVLVDGHLVLFVERGGKRILTASDDQTRLAAAAAALAAAVRTGRVPRIHIDRVDGEAAPTSPLGGLLREQGFASTPKGLRMHYTPHLAPGGPAAGS